MYISLKTKKDSILLCYHNYQNLDLIQTPLGISLVLFTSLMEVILSLYSIFFFGNLLFYVLEVRHVDTYKLSSFMSAVCNSSLCDCNSTCVSFSIDRQLGCCLCLSFTKNVSLTFLNIHKVSRIYPRKYNCWALATMIVML